jgi:nitrogen fixation-related uncharacterized protein
MTDPIIIMASVAWPFVVVALLIILWATLAHRYDEKHRTPSVSVREFMDAAKARQYGQPTVSTEVMDHYDARNDLTVPR